MNQGEEKLTPRRWKLSAKRWGKLKKDPASTPPRNTNNRQGASALRRCDRGDGIIQPW
jgi:hypothetical protein